MRMASPLVIWITFMTIVVHGATLKVEFSDDTVGQAPKGFEFGHTAKAGAVARSAARQSRRPYIPPVTGLVSTAELAQRVRDAGATALVLHESATVKLTELPVAQADSLLLIVGPEGGIADDEIAALSAAGATAVQLGPTVLRTSTAAAVALGALGALTSRWL